MPFLCPSDSHRPLCLQPAAHHPPPIAHRTLLWQVHFWSSRTIDLSGIHSQLERDGVKQIVAVLELAKSSYLTPFLKLSNYIMEETTKAVDNLKCMPSPRFAVAAFRRPSSSFHCTTLNCTEPHLAAPQPPHFAHAPPPPAVLQNLTEPCEKLAMATPSEIPAILPSILNMIRLIWRYSQFYNTSDRLTGLLRKVQCSRCSAVGCGTVGAVQCAYSATTPPPAHLRMVRCAEPLSPTHPRSRLRLSTVAARPSRSLRSWTAMCRSQWWRSSNPSRLARRGKNYTCGLSLLWSERGRKLEKNGSSTIRQSSLRLTHLSSGARTCRKCARGRRSLHGVPLEGRRRICLTSVAREAPRLHPRC